MANIINLATEENQEKILDKIQKVDAITTDSGWNIYQDIISASFEQNLTDDFKTILEVNGSGELLELVLSGHDIESLMNIKVIIDGKVIINRALKGGTPISATFPTFSIFLKGYLLFNMPYTPSSSTASNNYFYSILNKEYFVSFLRESSTITGNEKEFYLIKNPIVFNESLRIEGTHYMAVGKSAHNFSKNHILYRLT